MGKKVPFYLISNDDNDDILDEENVYYIELCEKIPSTRNEEKENIVDEGNVNYTELGEKIPLTSNDKTKILEKRKVLIILKSVKIFL